MANTTPNFRNPNIDTEALFVSKGQQVEIWLDNWWVIGRVNSTPLRHEGEVGFSVWNEFRAEGTWVKVPQDHPVVILG